MMLDPSTAAGHQAPIGGAMDEASVAAAAFRRTLRRAFGMERRPIPSRIAVVAGIVVSAVVEIVRVLRDR